MKHSTQIILTRSIVDVLLLVEMFSLLILIMDQSAVRWLHKLCYMSYMLLCYPCSLTLLFCLSPLSYSLLQGYGYGGYGGYGGGGGYTDDYNYSDDEDDDDDDEDDEEDSDEEDEDAKD